MKYKQKIDEDGSNMLIYAVKICSTEYVNGLIKNNAELNKQNDLGGKCINIMYLWKKI